MWRSIAAADTHLLESASACISIKFEKEKIAKMSSAAEIATQRVPQDQDKSPWWIGAVGYEIYIRSFADADGSGIGDLAGIQDKLEYLSWLGVDAIWITPFYQSPGFDHGYDVADYCGINPSHGTIEDFDKLVSNAHQLGLRVVIDLVPNHSSSHHAWFQNALTSKEAEFRDFYIWRDPAPDGGPPNNWVSHFGGPAWTLDPISNQYYCHLFLPEQPDLNWANPAVRDAIDDVYRFWCERGVDGFRLDVAHGLIKHPDFPDNPQIRPLTDDMGPTAIFESYDHQHDLDQDENTEIYERWNKLVSPYGAILLGEFNAPTPDRIARSSEGDRLHRSFFLRPGWTKWDPEALVEMFQTTHDCSPDGLSWILNNHDQPRSVSRFGGGSIGLRRTQATTTLLFGLGGMPFLYQGEELGLDNSKISAQDREDPVWTRNGSAEVGRDVTRGGMPWEPGETNGFTQGVPWLLEVPRDPSQTVSEQRDNVTSPLYWYRALLAMRRANPELWSEELSWVLTSDATSLAFTRGNLAVVANLGPDPIVVSFPHALRPIFESANGCTAVNGTSVTVAGESSVVLSGTT